MNIATAEPQPASMAPGLTDEIVRFACTLTAEGIDPVALHAARRHVMDTLGAIVAGAGQEVTGIALRALAPFGAAGALSVPGLPDRLDLLTAAYVAGTAAHGLELDDGYRAGMIHPGSVIVPVALLVGAREGRSGREMLAAVVAGYEVACRLGAITHPRMRWRGFHPTSAIGVLAGAVTAARLMGLDRGRTTAALGIAAAKASGIFSFLNGGDVKRLHSGHAAREAIVSALLAREGLKGPAGVVEYKYGFLNAYAAGDSDEFPYAGFEFRTAGGGGERSPFAITDCYIKPYACCRHIHPPIDAAAKALAALGGGGIDAIDSILIETYAVGVAHAEPKWTEMTTAQMSMNFALTTALRFGEVLPRHFDAASRSDPVTTGFCGRIRTVLSPELDALYPGKRAAQVTVTLKDGRSRTELVTEALGGARNPLSDAALEQKFRALADPVLKEGLDGLVARLWALDAETDLGSLLEAMRGDAP